MASAASAERCIALCYRGHVAIYPPQESNGYEVGDILTIRSGINPLKCASVGWFHPSGFGINDYLSDCFTPPEAVKSRTVNFDVGVVSKKSLNGKAKFQMPGGTAAAASLGGDKEEKQECKLEASEIELKRAVRILRPILESEDRMSELLQKETWLKANKKAAVCIVVNSVSGKLKTTRKDSSEWNAKGGVNAESPLTAGAEETNDESASGVYGVYAVMLHVFKVAFFDNAYHVKGPIHCEGIDCVQTRGIASWVQRNDLHKRDWPGFLGQEARQGVADLTRKANYIAATLGSEPSFQNAANTASNDLQALLGADGVEVTVAASFTVVNEKGKAEFEEARTRLVLKMDEDRPDDDQKQDNGGPGSKDEDDHGGLHGSVIVIRRYEMDVLSKMFELLKGGEVDLGEGWYLKGMRVALQFDMVEAGLLPVRIPDNHVDSEESPTKVLWCLDDGAFLLTPVEGLTEEKWRTKGKIFGNGDCPDWEMLEDVTFVDVNGLGEEKAKEQILEFQAQGYTVVQRSPSDIDSAHKPLQMKMVRYNLRPSQAAAGNPGSAQPAAVVALEEDRVMLSPASNKSNAVSPERPLKRKAHDRYE